jgi:hypothetical protein
MKKIQLVKDGAIQGWVVSFVFTIITMILLVAGFFNKTIMEAWKSLGGNYATLYLGSMGIWMGYKGLKSYTELNYRKYEENNGFGRSPKFP